MFVHQKNKAWILLTIKMFFFLGLLEWWALLLTMGSQSKRIIESWNVATLEDLVKDFEHVDKLYNTSIKVINPLTLEDEY